MAKARSHLCATLALAVLALILCYRYLRPHIEPASPAPPEKITIAYSATPDSVLAEVALLQGYFLREGLEVTVHRHPFGKPALEELLRGRADFATVAETPVMLAIMNGATISILATTQTANRVNAIVARRDRGIAAPGDLKGRRIAVTQGTTSDYFMDSFLAVHKIAPGEMTVVDLKPEQMGEALARGEVDAVSVFMPLPIQVQKKLGGRAVVFYDEHIYTSMFNMVTSQKLVREHPETARKLLRALVKAEGFVAAHPIEAQKMVAEFSRMDQGLVREVWQNYSYQVKLDQSLVLALEDETQWAIKGGLVARDTIPDYLDYIYPGALQSIRPKSVRILR
jgi:ABC-type nitrate/sulfonate/bicarbonate transport system substrate-binding protein